MSCVVDALLLSTKKAEAELATWGLAASSPQTTESVQKILKCDFGMDFEDLFSLLSFVGGRRMGWTEEADVRDLQAVVGQLTRIESAVIELGLSEEFGQKCREAVASFKSDKERHV